MVRIVSSVIVGGNDAKSREMLGGADVLGGITEGEATPEATEVCAPSCTAGPTKSMMQALWGRARAFLPTCCEVYFTSFHGWGTCRSAESRKIGLLRVGDFVR